MIIALDYDHTYTADLHFWNLFLTNSKLFGHEVICVTMRYAIEPCEIPCKVIYTQRKSKAKVCSELGIKVDIWIDDNPIFVHNDYPI